MRSAGAYVLYSFISFHPIDLHSSFSRLPLTLFFLSPISYFRHFLLFFQTVQNRNSPTPEVKSTETSQSRSIPEGKEERWLKKAVVSSSSSVGAGAGAGGGAEQGTVKGSEVTPWLYLLNSVLIYSVLFILICLIYLSHCQLFILWYLEYC